MKHRKLLISLVLLFILLFARTYAQTNLRTPTQIDSALLLLTSNHKMLDTIRGGYDGKYTTYKKFLWMRTKVEKGFWSHSTVRNNKILFKREDHYSSTNLPVQKNSTFIFYFLDNKPVKYQEIHTEGDYKNPIFKDTTTAYLNNDLIIYCQNNKDTYKKLSEKKTASLQKYIVSRSQQIQADLSKYQF